MPRSPRSHKPFTPLAARTDSAALEQQARRKAADAERPSAQQRGYTSRWAKARATYLKHRPLCAEHERHGKVAAATVVDHITPHRGDQKLFWDQGNWQPLCKPCHDKKTGRGQ